MSAIIMRPTVSDIVALRTRKWQAVVDHSSRWHYLPDMEALICVLTACTGQFQPNTEPIWLFVNGPSGSGKTSFLICAASALPNSHILGEITPKTFISGFKGEGNSSLLNTVGSSGILLFKDFTTFLSMRVENRTELGGQLREIADGSFRRATGSSDETWHGKITIIAATTPAVEHYWGLTRVMGDRWLQVRWPRLDGRKVAQMARKQQGHEKEIGERLRELTHDFFCEPRIEYPPPDITDEQSNRIAAMSEMLSHCRAHVDRAPDGNRQITDLPQVEQTGRIGKNLPALPRFHAALFGRDHVAEEDIRIATRVMFDSIPFTRCAILLAIPPRDKIAGVDICRLTGMSESSLKWNMEELIALGLIVESTDLLTMHEMSPMLRELWLEAFPPESE